MKLDMSQPLIDYDGEPLKGEGDKPMELRLVCCNALMAGILGEESLPGTKKMERFKLAQRIHDSRHGDYTVEEIALLKELTGKAFGPRIVGSAWFALENVEASKAPTDQPE